jgi:hypothetical protein
MSAAPSEISTLVAVFIHSGWKGFVSFAAIVGGALTYYLKWQKIKNMTLTTKKTHLDALRSMLSDLSNRDGAA